MFEKKIQREKKDDVSRSFKALIPCKVWVLQCDTFAHLFSLMHSEFIHMFWRDYKGNNIQNK